MSLKYSQKEIETICTPFFNEIQSNHFQVKLTVGGSIVIIMSRSAGGDKPVMGVYYTGTEWLPAKWSVQGEYMLGQKRQFDLMEFPKQDNEAA